MFPKPRIANRRSAFESFLVVMSGVSQVRRCFATG